MVSGPVPVGVMAAAMNAVVVEETQCMDGDDNDIEQAQSGGDLYARLRQWARSLHFTFLRGEKEGFQEEIRTLGGILSGLGGSVEYGWM